MKRLAASEKARHKKQDTKQSAESPGTKIDDGSPSGIVPQAVNAGNAEPAPGEKGNDSRKKKKPRDWMTIFTGLLVFVGFLTVILMGVQSVQNSQVIDATSESNRIARRNFETSQRAWISSKDAKLVEVGTAEKKLIAYVANFENVGESPAFTTRIYITTDFVLPSIEELRDRTEKIGEADCLHAYKVFSQSIFFPGQNYFRSAPIEASGDMIPVLHGCILYDSMNVTHAYKFCHFWMPEKGLQAPQWGSRMCPAGHFAD